MAKTIAFTPEAAKAINEFCDAAELETRIDLMDTLEGFFLESDEVDDHQARDGHQHRKSEGMAEARVGEGGNVVGNTDPRGVAGGGELAEREIDALYKGIQEPDAECQKRRQQEHVELALDRLADQRRIHRARLALFRLLTHASASLPSL